MKNPRTFLIAGLLIAVLSFAVVTYQMFFGGDRIELKDRSLAELLESGVLLGLIAVPLMLVITFLAMRPFLRILFPGRIEGGITAEARVLKVWDTGVSINNDPQVGLLLEVTTPEGGSFQAEAKTLVSRLQVGLVRPGIKAEVRYDPQRPRRLQIVSLEVQPAAGQSVESRLEELERLRERGLVTAEEYARKRAQILDEL